MLKSLQHNNLPYSVFNIVIEGHQCHVQLTFEIVAKPLKRLFSFQLVFFVNGLTYWSFHDKPKGII